MLERALLHRVALALAIVPMLLSSCRRTESTSELIARLRNSPSVRIQAEAARKLGERQALEAFPALIEALHAPWPVRASAARALGMIKDPRSVPALITVLRDDVPLVREAAAHALGNLRDSRAVEPLIAALREQNHEAGPALAQLGQAAVGPLVGCLREVEVRHSAAEALVHIGKLAVGPLIQALKSDEGYARLTAAQALSEIDDPRGTETLDAELRNGDLRLAAAAYRFLIRESLPGRDALLVKTLATYGHLAMAREFIQSGRPALKRAAERWAERNGYEMPALYDSVAWDRSRPQ